MTTTLWDGLQNARTVAQLVGVDAVGLVSMIVQAVQTVERNKKRCWQLVHQVMIIGGLLPLLQESEMMGHPEIRKPLEGLEDTLRQTYMLVTSCQHGNIVRRLLTAGSQAQKFRDIRNRIDLYLRIYPLISHIDTRRLLRGQDSRARHPSAPLAQASEEMPTSFVSPSNPDSRTHGSTSNDNNASVEVQAVTKPLSSKEQKQDGRGNAEPLPNRKHWFRWLIQWAKREPSTPESIHELIGPDKQSDLTIFELSQLDASTNQFSFHNVIGQGRNCKVYKGVLLNGIDVAIKKLHKFHNEDNELELEFENELNIISKLQHVNVIKLLGCCIESEERILVYEYMPRSLHDIIEELKGGVFLAWPLRFRIIEGIAQGAVYLHQHSRLRMVHGDLNPKNVLLDRDMTPRITDFGMAEVLSSEEDEKEMTTIKGTICYHDPEFLRRNIISTKSDVYGFGVTCLVIMTAQHAVMTPMDSDRKYLVLHAWELWLSGRAMDLIDTSLLDDDPQISEILRCMQIALLCVQEKREDRPTMSDVLMMLKCESMALPVPRLRQDMLTQGASDGSADGGTSFRSSVVLTEEDLEERS
ncbi:unnamed protein product [Urochloa decumbens]|uniref:non-specific serine/threonine protein kinase n=1 Tax=Urochloa decumbens TaxID=240449 RepID=A0ABC9HAA2_9POAL